MYISHRIGDFEEGENMKKRLFIARREKKKSQTEIGKVICLCKQSYHLKESGQREFKLSEAQTLAKYFKTTVDELFAE